MRTPFIAAALVAFTSTVLSAQEPVAPPPSPPQSPVDSLPPVCDLYNFSQDKQDGRRAAAKQRIDGWYAMGGAGGLLAPLVSTGILMVVAFEGKPPNPDSIPTGLDRTCFLEGFVCQARRERAVASWVGGIVGTTAGLLAVLSFGVDDAIVFPLVPGDIGKDNLMKVHP